MSSTPERSDFARCLHQRFRIHAGDGAWMDAELIEVRALGAGSESGREPFALVFCVPGREAGHESGHESVRGAQAAHLRQQIFRVEHDAMGALDLFLVPIGPDAQGMRLEAIFT